MFLYYRKKTSIDLDTLSMSKVNKEIEELQIKCELISKKITSLPAEPAHNVLKFQLSANEKVLRALLSYRKQRDKTESEEAKFKLLGDLAKDTFMPMVKQSGKEVRPQIVSFQPVKVLKEPETRLAMVRSGTFYLITNDKNEFYTASKFVKELSNLQDSNSKYLEINLTKASLHSHGDDKSRSEVIPTTNHSISKQLIGVRNFKSGDKSERSLIFQTNTTKVLCAENYQPLSIEELKRIISGQDKQQLNLGDVFSI